MSDETLTVCCECNGEVKQIFCGDEGWGVCSDCGITEGDTKEMLLEDWENMQ